MFRIPSRWNNRNGNRTIIDTALAKVQEQIDADIDDEIDIANQEDFLQRIRVMCNRLERNWGRQPYFVPATVWLNWKITNTLRKLTGFLETCLAPLIICVGLNPDKIIAG